MRKVISAPDIYEVTWDHTTPTIPQQVRVIIESPYAGDITTNVTFARACVRDSLLRGEAPIASHLLYTQPGILRDHLPPEREAGIRAGHAWMPGADICAVYTNLGVTSGMLMGIEQATKYGVPVEMRTLDSWPIKADVAPSVVI